MAIKTKIFTYIKWMNATNGDVDPATEEDIIEILQRCVGGIIALICGAILGAIMSTTGIIILNLILRLWR